MLRCLYLNLRYFFCFYGSIINTSVPWHGTYGYDRVFFAWMNEPKARYIPAIGGAIDAFLMRQYIASEDLKH